MQRRLLRRTAIWLRSGWSVTGATVRHSSPIRTSSFSPLLDWAFWLWAVVGVGFGFGISVVGLFTVPASAIATIVLLTQPRLRRSAYGVLVGIGAPLLVVAFLNREGPGTVCHSFDGGRGMQCDDLHDPRKWAAVGLAFVLSGLLAQILTAGPRPSSAS